MFFARSGWSLAVPVALMLVLLVPQGLATPALSAPPHSPAAHAFAPVGHSDPTHLLQPVALPAEGSALPPRPMAPHPGVAPWSWFNATPGLAAFQWVTGIPTAPPTVAGGAMAEYPVANSTAYLDVLFGGYDSNTGQASNQTWVYIGGQTFAGPNYWYNITNASDAPPALAYASMTYDPDIPAMVLFGGEYTNGSLSAETWFLSTTNFTWSNQTFLSCFFFCPNARYVASMAFAPDTADNDTVLFGGCSDVFCAGELNDTWALINFTGTYVWDPLSESTAPSERNSGSMAYGGSTVGGLVYFGGCDANYNCGLNDTWYFYNSVWTNLTSFITSSGSLTPPGRYAAEMSYVVPWDELLLTGGQNDTVDSFNDTWFFTCSFGCFWENWTSFYGGLDVIYASVADTTYSGDPLVYGGFNATSYNPSNVTWEFQAATVQNFSVSNLDPEVGEDVSVNSTLVSGPPGDFGYQLWIWTLPGVESNYTTNGEYASNISFPRAGTWYLNATALDQFDFTTQASFIVNVGTPSVTAHVAAAATDVGVTDQFTSSPGGTYTGPVSYTWTFGDGTNATSQNSNHVYSAEGNYTVSVKLVDALNNSATQSFHVVVNARPVASISASSTTVAANETVNFTSHVENGTPSFTYFWDFGDASSSSSATDASHSYPAAGNYTVTLKVADAVGTDANSTIVVHVVQTLVATASSNVTSAKIGVPIQFTATAKGGSGGTTFAWHFGDGTKASAASVSHAYAAAGTFTATVWVNDSSGTSVVRTLSVTISSGSSPSNPSSSSSSSGIPSWVWAVVVIVILAGIIGSVLILRGRRKPPTATPGPPPVWSESPATPPSPSGAPPPGAMGGSSPPGTPPSG